MASRFRASTAVKGIHIFFDASVGAEAVLIQAQPLGSTLDGWRMSSKYASVKSLYAYIFDSYFGILKP